MSCICVEIAEQASKYVEQGAALCIEDIAIHHLRTIRRRDRRSLRLNGLFLSNDFYELSIACDAKKRVAVHVDERVTYVAPVSSHLGDLKAVALTED